ncbi:hypothetical protein [Marinobacter sp. DS40M6]|uniref:hypothetical protein n=1 Tax=Marinobacter sp. DS40M6 TaxID=1597776 RepID=UPI002358D880|nr:hypothetical protein [Marinobacter sp. DS40M6]MDC8455349.1 hypothetical protein [Marinobacter sp. DS40M6]
MPEDSNDIFKRIQERISKYSWWLNRPNPPDLKHEINRLIEEAITVTAREYPKNDGRTDELKPIVEELVRKNGTYQSIVAAVATYEKRHTEHNNQHLELRKIENAQGLRTLMWRTVSTFAFASVIFFFYWLAGCLGVQLPLSRFGM